MVAEITVADGIATISFNRPDVLNAVGLDGGFATLRSMFETLRDDASVRAIILTGQGRAFCAGAELDGFVQDGELTLTPERLRQMFDIDLNALLRVIQDLPKPFVTAINGTVAGGGLGLALTGDIVLASDRAKFHCAFLKILALVPDAGTSWMLPSLMGRNRALPFALLGDGITAEEALGAGLIFRSVPADILMAEAWGYAERLAQMSPEALRQTRRLFTDAPSMSYDAMLDQEREANCLLVQGGKTGQGVVDFLSRRRSTTD